MNSGPHVVARIASCPRDELPTTCQLMPSKRTGVPYPGSLHAPSPHPRATGTSPSPSALTRPTSSQHACQPPQTCPGPSDSLAPSQRAGVIQACLTCPSHAPAPATTSCMHHGPLQCIPAAPDVPRASPMCYGPYPCALAGPMHCALVSSCIPTQLRDLGHHPTCPAIPSASHSSWPHHATLRVVPYHAHGPCPTSLRHRCLSLPVPSSSWPLQRLPYSPRLTSAASITSAAPLFQLCSMPHLGACPCSCVSSPELSSTSMSHTLRPCHSWPPLSCRASVLPSPGPRPHVPSALNPVSGPVHHLASISWPSFSGAVLSALVLALIHVLCTYVVCSPSGLPEQPVSSYP